MCLTIPVSNEHLDKLDALQNANEFDLDDDALIFTEGEGGGGGAGGGEGEGGGEGGGEARIRGFGLMGKKKCPTAGNASFARATRVFG